MLIEVETNHFGHLTARPVSDRIASRYAAFLRLQGASKHSDGSVYLQTDYDIESFLGDLPKRAARDIREGWTVRVRIADFGAWLGYDASNIDPRRSLRSQGIS